MTGVIGDAEHSREKEKMKTAKSAAKKTTKGAKAPTKGKKAKVPVTVPIEVTASESLPFDATEATTPETAQPAAPPKVEKPKKSKPSATPAKPAAKLGVLAAAHQVLSASASPMNCAELIEAMAAQKLWSSPNGKTPAQTLYAAVIREISKKGAEARFIKTERGKFTAAGKA